MKRGALRYDEECQVEHLGEPRNTMLKPIALLLILRIIAEISVSLFRGQYSR